MTAQEEQILADGIQAVRAGDHNRARTLLTQVLAINVGSELAWLWMSSVLETPLQRRECLLRVLEINPNNEPARRGLALLEEQLGPVLASEEPRRQPVFAPDAVLVACPFCKSQTDSAELDCMECGENLILSCPNCEKPIQLWDTTRCPCGEGLRHYIFFPDGIDHEGLGQRYAMAERWEAAARQWDRALRDGSHLAMLHRKLAQAYDKIGRASEAVYHRQAATS